MREHIPGADNVPLAEIDRLQAGNCPVVFHCRSGARTGANAARLVAATGAPCYVLEGGIDAWRRAGLEVAADRRPPLELLRQVQLVAGGQGLGRESRRSGTGMFIRVGVWGLRNIIKNKDAVKITIS